MLRSVPRTARALEQRQSSQVGSKQPRAQMASGQSQGSGETEEVEARALALLPLCVRACRRDTRVLLQRGKAGVQPVKQTESEAQHVSGPAHAPPP
jgi:hypothetical protein